MTCENVKHCLTYQLCQVSLLMLLELFFGGGAGGGGGITIEIGFVMGLSSPPLQELTPISFFVE